MIPWKPSGSLRQTRPAHLVGDVVGFDTTEWCLRTVLAALERKRGHTPRQIGRATKSVGALKSGWKWPRIYPSVQARNEKTRCRIALPVGLDSVTPLPRTCYGAHWSDSYCENVKVPIYYQAILKNSSSSILSSAYLPLPRVSSSYRRFHRLTSPRLGEQVP